MKSTALKQTIPPVLCVTAGADEKRKTSQFSTQIEKSVENVQNRMNPALNRILTGRINTVFNNRYIFER